VRIRRANQADIPAIMELERRSSDAAHWPRDQYAALFVSSSSQQPSQRFAWVAEEEHRAPSEIVAFLIAHRIDAEWDLENIVVAEKSRRRGVGTLLLNELIADARAQTGSGIFLEVRESNQAGRGLYRKVGFREVGLRKGYYSKPPEDAILCRLRL